MFVFDRLKFEVVHDGAERTLAEPLTCFVYRSLERKWRMMWNKNASTLVLLASAARARAGYTTPDSWF
jgi:hypothetical protein